MRTMKRAEWLILQMRILGSVSTAGIQFEYMVKWLWITNDGEIQQSMWAVDITK
jgi:hypothetical protein